MQRDSLSTIRSAVIIPRYYPVFGGAENQCRLLNRHMVLTGRIAIPFVVTRRVDKGWPREEAIDGIPVRRLGFGGSSRWSEYWYYLCAFLFLLARRHEFDLIHCHATSVIGFIMTVLGRMLRKPVILKLSTNGELLRRAEVRRSLPARIVGASHGKLAAYTTAHAHVIALNGEGMDELAAAGARRRYLIPNGVDVSVWRSLPAAERRQLRSRYGFGDDDYLFVYTGRFVRRKGIDVIIDGYRKLMAKQEQKGAAIHLCLVGNDGIQKDDAVMGLLKNLEQDPAVNLHIVKSQDSVLQYLQLADAFVHASRNEGLPNAVLEALAVGLPCILSDISPHLELWDQHRGMGHHLFKTGDSGSLADAMERCYLEAASRASAPPAASSLEARYSIEQVTRQYLALYGRVI